MFTLTFLIIKENPKRKNPVKYLHIIFSIPNLLKILYNFQKHKFLLCIYLFNLFCLKFLIMILNKFACYFIKFMKDVMIIINILCIYRKFEKIYAKLKK